MGVENALAATLLEACDLVDFVDMETGRTLMLRKDLPRGDISTTYVDDVCACDVGREELSALARQAAGFPPRPQI